MLKLSIITPEKIVFEGDVDSVSMPTPQGEITVLPHHIPLISIVTPGSVLVRMKGKEELFAVSRGVIEVDGTHIKVLADTADRAEELELVAIEKAKAEAEKLTRERRADTEGFAEATAILERELARMQVVRRHRKQRGIPHSDSNS